MDTSLSGTELAAAVADFLMAMPVVHLLGLRVLACTPGETRLELPVRHDLTFDGHTVKGGIVGALADFAGASAAATVLPAGWVVMTTGFEVHNLAPARGEHLLGIGTVIKPGRSLAVSRADVFAVAGEERRLCATALVTTRGVERAPARTA